MELIQVKRMLHQTECGELLMDGMGCSEPVLIRAEDGLVDLFFVYYANKKAGTFSGPVARIGLDAERGVLVSMESCYEKPFSVAPDGVIAGKPQLVTDEQYEEYCRLYPAVRELAYREVCTDQEKAVLAGYDKALRAIVNPALFPFYQELAPAFFTWLSELLGSWEERKE